MKKTNLCEWLAALLALIFLVPSAGRAQTNSPGKDLAFSGSGQSVFVLSQPALNAYPITVMAWIKTTTTNLCAVVNKYHAVTTSGYQLFLLNGHIKAFYFASAGNDVPVNTTPLDGGVVNDGAWHHVAFTVGPTGAWIYRDGVPISQAPWTGTPGPTTTSESMYFGYYPGISVPGESGYYTGEIDEISLWNTVLTPAEIQTYMNRSLSGYEPNLVGYWRLDEGAGSQTADNSGNGNTAYFLGSPAWTSSTAPVGIVPPSGYSSHWTPVTTAPNQSWYGVAASADGLKLAGTVYGGGIYTSTNAGASWQITSAPTKNWFGIASSADGATLIAGNDTSLYRSLDSGLTWTPANVPTNWNYENVCCSADGRRMAAATFSGGKIFISSDAGGTWSNTYNVTYCTSLASSSDGMKLAAVGASLYTSIDGGTNWSISGAPHLDWNKVASSADGSTLLAAVFTYQGSTNLLYLSRDSGTNWVPAGVAANTWNAVAMSADGTKMLASLAPGIIYVSTDAGASWQPTDTASDYWNQIATSADGTRSVALSSKVVTSLSPPALHVMPSGGGMVVAWPSPSAGFLLEQNASLGSGNWSFVPIRPTVTNSQNQVTMPPSDANFYRLAFP